MCRAIVAVYRADYDHRGIVLSTRIACKLRVATTGEDNNVFLRPRGNVSVNNFTFQNSLLSSFFMTWAPRFPAAAKGDAPALAEQRALSVSYGDSEIVSWWES
jgi:hypothetical protein